MWLNIPLTVYFMVITSKVKTVAADLQRQINNIYIQNLRLYEIRIKLTFRFFYMTVLYMKTMIYLNSAYFCPNLTSHVEAHFDTMCTDNLKVVPSLDMCTQLELRHSTFHLAPWMHGIIKMTQMLEPLLVFEHAESRIHNHHGS